MRDEPLHRPDWEFRERVEEGGYLFDIYRCTRCHAVIATNAGQRPTDRGERHGTEDGS